MERDSKLGYGFLLVGAGVPYLVEKLFGPIWSLVSSFTFVVVGALFLLSAHRQGQKLIDFEGKRLATKIAVIALIAIAIGFTLGAVALGVWRIATRNVYEAKSAQQAVSPTRPSSTQPVQPQQVPSKEPNPPSKYAPKHSLQEEMPQLIFSDSPVLTPRRRDHISRVIDAFRVYLRGVGFDVSQQVFPIGVRPGKVSAMSFITPGDSYDGRILIGEDSIDDPLALRAVYARYYFAKAIGNVETAEGLSGQLEIVYQVYFLESFTGRRLTPSSSKWNDALWDLRKQFGAKRIDMALCIGLQRRVDSRRFKSANAYTANVVERGLEPFVNDVTEFASVEKLFKKYELLPPSP